MATQEERRNATQAAVIDAAFTTYVREGSPDVSLEDVAKEAGVTKGAILYHYGNRTGLLAAVAVRLFLDIEHRATDAGATDACTYVTALLEAQAEPVGRVLFTIGDELLRVGSIEAIDPYRHLRERLDAFQVVGSTAVLAGAILQFARQLAFGLAERSEIPEMIAALGLDG